MATLVNALQSLEIGAPQQFRNLAAFPLLNRTAGAPDYITLSEAVARGVARITEMSEGGSVPQLLLDNTGTAKVLILDGEELIGARQNRIANLTILAAAESKTVLPVSCVEAGRWAYRSREFQVSERAMFHRARASKAEAVSQNLKATGTYGADQGAVWNHIAAKQRRMQVESPSSAMADMFDQHHERVEDYTGRFRPVQHQVGVVFAIDGVVEGMDLFDAPQTLAAMLPKLTRSFAIDALESGRGRDIALDPALAARFLDRVAAAQLDRYPGVGIGTDLRLSAPQVAGGGLLDGDKLIHLVAFSRAGGGAGDRREDSDGTARETRLRARRYEQMRNRNSNH